MSAMLHQIFNDLNLVLLKQIISLKSFNSVLQGNGLHVNEQIRNCK